MSGGRSVCVLVDDSPFRSDAARAKSLLLAIDPGDVESAALLYDTQAQRPAEWLEAPNAEILHLITTGWDSKLGKHAVIEMIASYGMPVGREIFMTCVWIGRFTEAHYRRTGVMPGLLERPDIKLHLCASRRAKDANIRQALLDRYGPGKDRAVGRKAEPGPLYGISKHAWAALAVAVTWADTTILASETAA